ncbi:type VI secretion system-associated FHA domain protein TagH [Rhodovulum sp. 12E13]|uniref:type VI secretion system-associated FHA domain protein TagH n=1 Tax=Rhodovulum sp. 12E13 TaxID=2203891 RepID=UPI000E1A1E9A|nr:type VI secretion system-associated FHA domain protein TagH [Rhodovulum sp. 12E13]RDC74063.1 type VI secretion system-associated FHA domain protein TagH [Rhodovulum sp. 12E13]
MAVRLKFQSSGAIPGDGRPVAMRGGSLTVGRGPANDLVLPDPERTLSKSHFVIEAQGGEVVVVDLSTNGTFLNYSRIPLGRTPTPLNDGDVLSAGPYELVVEIAADAPEPGLAAPVAQEAVSFGSAEAAPDPAHLLDAPAPEGDFLDDLLGAEGPVGPSGLNIPDPIDELLPPEEDRTSPLDDEIAPPEEPGGDSPLLHGASVSDSYRSGGGIGGGIGGGGIIPDDWDADPFGEDEPLAPPVPPRPGAPPAEAAPQDSQPAPQPASPPAAAQQPRTLAPGGARETAARAFLEALDVAELSVPDDQLVPTMERMGRVMRAMIAGLREVLMTRTSIKNEFRIDQTMISAQGNNPLKFSVSPDQAVEALVRPRARGYLDAEAATNEALRDIKAHEVAMVTGMEAALKGVLARLDPAALAGQIESSGNLGSVFKGKKARYWEVYEKMYAEISDQAENDFHELFSREFARAYKEQLKKL